MGTLLQDLRYAARALARNPGFTLVAILTLALGIGINTAIFSVVNGVLIRPLSYDEPDRVVRLLGSGETGEEGDGTLSYANFVDWREQSTVFEGIAAYDNWRPTLTRQGEAGKVEAGRVSANYFSVLGVQPAAGRFFLPEEDEPGSAQVIVLSHGFWTQQFGADPTVLGQTLELNGTLHTIVGVAPSDFEDPRLWKGDSEPPQLWGSTPGHWDDEGWNERGITFLNAVARLRPGVSMDRAQAEMNTIMRRLHDAYPGELKNETVRLVGLKEQIVGPVRPALLILLAAVGLVLLIACANVANLMLTRAAGREREIAVRTALGASRGRIIQQLLVESVLLAMMGGAVGILLASTATDLIVALGAGELPRLDRIGIDGRVLAFAAGVSVLTGILFGLAPALQASRTDLQSSLRAGGHGSTAGRGQRRFRNALVAAEVALTVVLLVGAGLLIRSLWSLQRVDPGFRTSNVLTMATGLPADSYGDDAQVRQGYQQILERLSALPGVEAAGAVNVLPMSGDYWATGFSLTNQPPERGTDGPGAEFRAATPDLFRALGTPVLRGRGFTEQDGPDAPPVVVINQAAATRYWPDEDPIGRQITLPNEVSYEIVGIVGDVHQFALDQAPEPSLYLAYAQAPSWLTRNAVLILRTASDPLSLAPAAREALWSIDPQIPISDVRTMERVLSDTLTQPKFRTVLLAIFAAVAFLLGAVGIYGVVAYGVTQRTREIGIRLTLGARGGEILEMVIRQGMVPVLLGIGIGIIGAFGVSRVISSLLFGVSGTDPITFVAVPLLLGSVAALACYLPARRAARVDPMVALRSE